MLKNHAGFTLIELVMVIVLLGILAAVAVPRYVNLQEEARNSVLDASIGAMKSAAIIQFAQTRSANTFASIYAATELDSNVSVVSGGNCNDATLQYGAGLATRAFTISSSFCSN